MRCSNCGYDNPEGAVFCAHCAARLGEQGGAPRPTRNVIQGPRWADPDFSADSVSEDDVPHDFVSEYSAPKLDSVEDRRAAAEAAAQRARLAAESARAKRDAEEQRTSERRAFDEQKATERRTMEEQRRIADEERENEELRIAEEQFRREQQNIRRPGEYDDEYDDEDDDEDDYEPRQSRRPVEKGLAFFSGLFKHKEKPRTASVYDDDEDDFEDDYPSRPSKKNTGIKGFFSNKKAMNLAIRIAIIVAAVAVLGLLIALIASKCTGKTDSPTGTNKAPTIEANPDDESSYFVTIFAKEGKVLIFETADGSRKEVTVPASGFVKFRVPVSSLMPGEPVDGSTYQAVPKVYIKNDDGTETLVDGYEPAYVMLQIPAINVRFDNTDTIVSDSGTIEFTGRIDLVATQLTIDGQNVPIAQDGSFSHTVVFEESGDYTVNAEARLAGHQIYRHSFNVTVTQASPSTPLVQLPWEYGDTNFSQRVKNSVDTIEVQGRAPAGATVTVACDSSNATLTTPVVNDDGSFSFRVTMAYAGDYTLVITATTETQVSSREMHVQRAPEWTTYVSGAMSSTYASFSYASSQGYKISGTVTEIIEEGDYILAVLTLSDGNTIVLEYHNHYASAGTVTVGKTYEKIYGRPMGTNANGVPQVYVWFIDD